MLSDELNARQEQLNKLNHIINILNKDKEFITNINITYTKEPPGDYVETIFDNYGNPNANIGMAAMQLEKLKINYLGSYEQDY